MFRIFEVGGWSGRDATYLSMRETGVMVRQCFFTLSSDLPMYATNGGGAKDSFPVAMQCAEKVLCLPIHPEMSAADYDHVIDSLIDAISVS